MPRISTEKPLSSAAFGELFVQYKPCFVAVARSYVRDVSVAEDLVVDSFMTFWENRDQIEIRESVPAYILATVKRRCLNWLRDRAARLRAQQEIHSVASRIVALRISSLEAAEPSALFAEEVSAIVERELERMPERMRGVFIASRYDEETYKEIAERFSLSLNQVDFELRKATRLLRAALDDYLTDDDKR